MNRFLLKTFKRKIAPLIFALVFFILLIESSIFLLNKLGIVYTPSPSYSFKNVWPSYWAVEPVVGKWHSPCSQYMHQLKCYKATYRANSCGARDIERPLLSPKKRIIVLGDSFIEGMGVPLEKRLTNILEKETHIEHLNFGNSGTGPLQYLLLYNTLAIKFSHQGVMIGILPRNDLLELDVNYSYKANKYSYMPYIVGEYPNYKIIYFNNYLSDHLQMLRLINYGRLFFQEFSHVPGATSAMMGYKIEQAKRHEAQHYSGYYDYKEETYFALQYVIQILAQNAKGKEIAVFTIPGLDDFKRYHKEKDFPENFLGMRLHKLSRKMKFDYVDLLYYMYYHTENWESYFNSCEGHWNEHGNLVAARYLEQTLTIYKNLQNHRIQP